ncbi:MAG TPA: hypothetical protein VIS77_12405 [Burkholderiales bacterium]
MKGPIQPALVETLRQGLAKVNRERQPAGAIVILDSHGGDGLAAIEAGRLLREARAHVFVRGRCASACLFIFAGGEVRAAPEGAIGMHRARITRRIGDGPATTVVADEDARAARLLEEGNRRVRAYFEEMGFGPAVYEAMMQVPADETRNATRAELTALGLLADDARARAAQRAQDECLPEAKGSTQFARCYRRLAAESSPR